MPTPYERDEDTPISLVTLLNNYIRRDEHERMMLAVQSDIGDMKESTQSAISEIRHDVKELREKDLKELQDAIIKKQSEGQDKTIKVLFFLLASFCTPIIVSIVIYVIETLLK